MADVVSLVLYVLSWWLAWSSAVLAQRNKGRNRWRQQLAGLLHGWWFSTVIGWLVVPPAAWWGYLIGGFALLLLWSFKDNLRAGRSLFDDGKPKPEPKSATITPTAVVTKTPLSTQATAPLPDKTQVIKARADHDKEMVGFQAKRDALDTEHKRTPLAQAQLAAPVVPAATYHQPQQKTKRRAPRLEGSKLDTIRFTYLNAEGEHSERRVVVRVVDDDYFEGRCLIQQSTRTFRLDRIIGCITSEQTGEVADPYAWASGLGRSVEAPRTTVAAPSTEILFTGFRKAERDELERMAEAAGMIVRKSVTQNLGYLCAGPTAGPSKLEQARCRGTLILSKEEFLATAETSRK